MKELNIKMTNYKFLKNEYSLLTLFKRSHKMKKIFLIILSLLFIPFYLSGKSIVSLRFGKGLRSVGMPKGINDRFATGLAGPHGFCSLPRNRICVLDSYNWRLIIISLTRKNTIDDVRFQRLPGEYKGEKVRYTGMVYVGKNRLLLLGMKKKLFFWNLKNKKLRFISKHPFKIANRIYQSGNQVQISGREAERIWVKNLKDKKEWNYIPQTRRFLATPEGNYQILIDDDERGYKVLKNEKKVIFSKRLDGPLDLLTAIFIKAEKGYFYIALILGKKGKKIETRILKTKGEKFRTIYNIKVISKVVFEYHLPINYSIVPGKGVLALNSTYDSWDIHYYPWRKRR
ncbi:hypothetical protein ACFL35_14205 [Candidatus Riflebacteria bacterium]